MLTISFVILVAAFFQGVASQSTAVAPTTPPNITVTTAVPSPTAPSASLLPSQVALPPVQAWCPSEIFCAGSVRWFQCYTWPDGLSVLSTVAADCSRCK